MTVLITGASGGLGRAMALECAQRGYDLFLTDMRQESLELIRNGLIRQYPVKIYAKACDLTSSQEVEDLFSYMKQQGILLHMLLNIAGIDNEGGFLELKCEQLVDIVKVNVEASLRVLYHALQQRDTMQKFTIVIVSSLASLYPIPLKATYAASKRFLLDFSLSLAQELRGENATVLALCPGGLPTTQGALQGIAAQGFWGRATTNSLPLVARRTISRALKGRRLYIPGAINRTFSILGKLVPRPALAKLLYGRWKDARASHVTP